MVLKDEGDLDEGRGWGNVTKIFGWFSSLIPSLSWNYIWRSLEEELINIGLFITNIKFHWVRSLYVALESAEFICNVAYN